jgi:hypothetical protein
VLHEVPAELPACLDAGRHKGVTVVQVACMRLILPPGMHSGSVACLGGDGNVGLQRDLIMEISSKVGPWGGVRVT